MVMLLERRHLQVFGPKKLDPSSLSYLLGYFLNLPWTFRILAHEEDQYIYVYKILGRFFVHGTHTAWSRASEFGNSSLH